MFISFIIPTYNPGNQLDQTIEIINDYSKKFKKNIEIIIIDSESDDGSTRILKNKRNVKFIAIKRSEFNHGGTRNKALFLSKGDILIYLTQDAMPQNAKSFDNLIKSIESNSSIGMAYGRQLPKRNADFFGKFAREFNYPSRSIIKTWESRKKLGIKTVFVSNSFAAYRRITLEKVGGFPSSTILSEDTYVAAKMLKNGWNIAYEADACVYHSHNYSCMQEFKRYFDTGVFYGKEDWILRDFSDAEREGIKFIICQFSSVIKEWKFYLIPSLLIRNIMKYIGYQLGLHEGYLPLILKKRYLSMNKLYWENIDSHH